ncbi:electron transfer flavoprotein subunit alpha [Serratia sp. L9]|uniref:electron transfer flavoprotein subunit alpha n=1 Tax=Serratia sp. L9 TaxID=3423946 RepID=UPI003D66B211
MSKLTNIWVFSDNVERYGELMAGARLWGEQVYAVVQDNEQASRIKPLGADRILILEKTSALQRIENYAETLATIIKEVNSDQAPTLLLMAATKRAKALTARLGVLLNAAVVNDVTAVQADETGFFAEHRMYGGLAFGKEKINSTTAIITLAPGVLEPATANPTHDCPITSVSYVAPRQEILCKERRAKSLSSVDLSKAKRVIGVGRGLAAQDDLKMIHDLAAALGAEVGCSRPIAEGENWMERERYIGVSGVLLKSDIYLMLGISGQIQHMVGGNGAKIIIAVNKDKNAPIFNYADYGLVGDIYKVVPALIDHLAR